MTSLLTRLMKLASKRRGRTWPVQDAKARFSELLDACLRDGPQVVTKRGTEAAVVLPMDEWQRLKSSARPTLKDLLMAEQPRMAISVPARGRRRRRPGTAFD